MSSALNVSNYDQVLVLATWGNPETWQIVDYDIEDYEGREEGCISTTIAILKALEKKGYRSKNRDLLIFMMDTLLPELMPELDRESIVRKRIIEHLFEILFEEPSGIMKLDYVMKHIREHLQELGFNNVREVVEFVPGTITKTTGERKIIWKCDHLFDAIHIVMLLGILKKLRSMEGERVLIIADISHGINYAVHFLTRVLPLAATLYAMERIAEQNPLEDLTIQYFNSDPLRADEESSRLINLGVTLKIHNVAAQAIVTSSASDLSSLLNFIRSVEDLQQYDLKSIAVAYDIDEKVLRNAWKAVRCYVYGALPWALHIAQQVKDYLPSEDSMRSLIENVKIEKEREETNSVIYCYNWGSKAPSLLLTLITIMIRNLAQLAENVKANEDERGLVLRLIKEHKEKVPREIEKIMNNSMKSEKKCKDDDQAKRIIEDELPRALERLEQSISRSESLILVLNKMRPYIHKLYSEPEKSLIDKEFSSLIEDSVQPASILGPIFIRFGGRSDKASLTIAKDRRKVAERLGKRDSEAEYSRLYMNLKPSSEHLSPEDLKKELRNFYAHAGLSLNTDICIIQYHGQRASVDESKDYYQVFLILGDASSIPLR